MSEQLGALALLVDRALALDHRDDDEPCSCDECMSYGAEDAGADWYRVPPANRVAMRILDGADDRLEPLTQAFRDHAAAQPSTRLDVERLGLAWERVIAGWYGDSRTYHYSVAEAMAREYARLTAEKQSEHGIGGTE